MVKYLIQRGDKIMENLKYEQEYHVGDKVLVDDIATGVISWKRRFPSHLYRVKYYLKGAYLDEAVQLTAIRLRLMPDLMPYTANYFTYQFKVGDKVKVDTSDGQYHEFGCITRIIEEEVWDLNKSCYVVRLETGNYIGKEIVVKKSSIKLGEKEVTHFTVGDKVWTSGLTRSGWIVEITRTDEDYIYKVEFIDSWGHKSYDNFPAYHLVHAYRKHSLRDRVLAISNGWDKDANEIVDEVIKGTGCKLIITVEDGVGACNTTIKVAGEKWPSMPNHYSNGLGCNRNTIFKEALTEILMHKEYREKENRKQSEKDAEALVLQAEINKKREELNELIRKRESVVCKR